MEPFCLPLTVLRLSSMKLWEEEKLSKCSIVCTGNKIGLCISIPKARVSFLQAFIFILFWYQLYCGFTGAVMIDQLYLMLYNVLFTSLPPLILGIYDQDCPAHLLLRRPTLYAPGRRSKVGPHASFRKGSPPSILDVSNLEKGF